MRAALPRSRFADDNIFRMMRRFDDKWYCDTTRTDCSSEPYSAVMSASPWYTGLAKTDLPHLYGDGSVSHVANEEDFFDRSEVFQTDTAHEVGSHRTAASIHATRLLLGWRRKLC